MRLFIVAGESSGDQLGADLVLSLQQNTEVELTGVGGPSLTERGLKSLFPMTDLAVMGWRDVYLRLPLLLYRLKQTIDAIVRTNPDIVVLVDSQEFSNRIAAGVRKRLPNAKIVLYVAPSVWAWKPERAQQVKPLYDEILGILPFEPRVFKELGGPTCTYVGHMAERLILSAGTAERSGFLLLPGSRVGEIKRNLSEIDAARQWVRDAFPTLHQTLAASPGNIDLISGILNDANVEVAEGRDNFKQFVANAHAAIAVSGTVTLELGFASVPHVCTYLAEPKQLKHYLANGSPAINLNNIIVGRKFVPEVTGIDALAPQILAETQKLLESEPELTMQREGFEEMRAKMQNGEPEAPRQNAAERILSLVN